MVAWQQRLLPMRQEQSQCTDWCPKPMLALYSVERFVRSRLEVCHYKCHSDITINNNRIFQVSILANTNVYQYLINERTIDYCTLCIHSVISLTWGIWDLYQVSENNITFVWSMCQIMSAGWYSHVRWILPPTSIPKDEYAQGRLADTSIQYW